MFRFYSAVAGCGLLCVCQRCFEYTSCEYEYEYEYTDYEYEYEYKYH